MQINIAFERGTRYTIRGLTINFGTHHCLLWQQWTETSVWFNDVQRFTALLLLMFYGNLYSEWHLMLSECVLVCLRKTVEISC
jgi:hypothetical protein